MREQHVSPHLDWNYVHNLMYSVADLLEEGKLKEANALSLKIPAARGELAPSYYIYMARDSITRVNPRLPVALRTGNWTQVLRLLQASQPPAGKPHLDFLARQLARFATGMQAAENASLAPGGIRVAAL